MIVMSENGGPMFGYARIVRGEKTEGMWKFKMSM